jgi:hypothetical protein
MAIAIDATPGDIIISCASDMLAYESIDTLWRPVSNDMIQVYTIPDLLLTLGITRAQLIALCSAGMITTGIFGLLVRHQTFPLSG